MEVAIGSFNVIEEATVYSIVLYLVVKFLGRYRRQISDTSLALVGA